MSQSIKTLVILFICLLIFIELISYYMLTNVARSMDFVQYAIYFWIFTMVIKATLLTFFGIWTYKKKYKLVFGSIVLFFVLGLLRGSVLFIGVTNSFGKNWFEFLEFIAPIIFVAHACAIIFSEARENKWLRIYAITIILVSGIERIIKNFVFEDFFWITAIASICTPIILIFLIRDDEKKAARYSDSEILD